MPQDLPPDASIREDNFAAIRLVAAILVIFGHAFPLTGSVGPGYLGSPVSTLAVKVFFVISGYLICGSWLRDPNVSRYMLRRALRIFPGLIVLCILTVGLVGVLITSAPVRDYLASPATWNYFSNVLLYPNYHLPGVFAGNIYPGAVNGSLWTLPVEFAMYLLLPLVLLLPCRRYAVIAMLVGLAVASIWFTRLYAPSQPTVIWGTSLTSALEMAPYFFAGAVYRMWVPQKFLNLQWGLMLLVLVALFARTPLSAEIACLVLTPYLTLALGYARPPVFGFVEKFGDPSYGVYLYGFLCQQIVAHFLPVREAPLANFALSVIPAIALGMLSWRLIEKPALSWKPGRRAPRPAARADNRHAPGNAPPADHLA